MSSNNSNDNDELMEEGFQIRSRQTKLQKFLRIIDYELQAHINQYLANHANPNPIIDHRRPDKIKLYHDLLIIKKFKLNQQDLKKSNKIREICAELQTQTNLSIATLRQRIQKKLANVTKEELMFFIQKNKDLTFDTKRKLVITKKKGIQRQFGFSQENSNEGPIQISSGQGAKNSSSVQLMQPPKPKSIQSQKKEEIESKSIKQASNQEQDMERNVFGVSFMNPMAHFNNINNDLCILSDHSSDDEILIIKGQNSYRINSIKGEKARKQSMDRILEYRKQIIETTSGKKQQIEYPKQMIQKMKKRIQKQGEQKQTDKRQGKQDKWESILKYREDPKIEGNYGMLGQKASDYKQQKQSINASNKLGKPEQPYVIDSQGDSISQSELDSPPQHKIKNNFTAQQKKITPQDQSSQWTQEEDQFLREISRTKDVKDWEILKKYKPIHQIKERAHFLGIILPSALQSDQT